MAYACPSAAYQPQAHVHEQLELLGEGTFAKVYKVTCTVPGYQPYVFARKIFKTQVSGDEAQTLKSVGGHPYIVQYLNDGIYTSGECFLEMEYCPGGTLDTHLQIYKPSRSTKMSFMREIASAVEFLHGRGIAHRDLKPDNIMIYYPYGLHGAPSIKVGDFGLAKLTIPCSTMSTVCGTPTFAAPEVFQIPPPGQETQYKMSADIFSMGVIFCAMLKMTVVNGKIGFPEAYNSLDIAKLASELKLDPNTHMTLLRLLGRMLKDNPSQRPSASDISHELLQVQCAESSCYQ